MNLGQLKTLVSEYVDDPNQTYFTPSQLTRFLNLGLREVQKLMIGSSQEYNLKCLQTSLVVSQREYTLPEDFNKLNRLEVVISGTYPSESVIQLVPITPNQRDLMPSNLGTPQAYHYKKNKLVVYPAPDQVKTMRLLYTYTVPEMTIDADVPDVPEQYHELIAILAGIYCFIKDDRDATLLINQREEYIARMKSDAAQRSVDQSRHVLETGAYVNAGDWDMF